MIEKVKLTFHCMIEKVGKQIKEYNFISIIGFGNKSEGVCKIIHLYWTAPSSHLCCITLFLILCFPPKPFRCRTFVSNLCLPNPLKKKDKKFIFPFSNLKFASQKSPKYELELSFILGVFGTRWNLLKYWLGYE